MHGSVAGQSALALSFFRVERGGITIRLTSARREWQWCGRLAGQLVLGSSVSSIPREEVALANRLNSGLSERRLPLDREWPSIDEIADV